MENNTLLDGNSPFQIIVDYGIWIMDWKLKSSEINDSVRLTLKRRKFSKLTLNDLKLSNISVMYLFFLSRNNEGGDVSERVFRRSRRVVWNAWSPV